MLGTNLYKENKEKEKKMSKEDTGVIKGVKPIPLGRPPGDELLSIVRVGIPSAHLEQLEGFMAKEGIPSVSEAVRGIIREWVKGRMDGK